jgi:hypothetical protein
MAKLYHCRPLRAYRAFTLILIFEIATAALLRSLANARPNWGDALEIGPIVWAWAAVLLIASIGTRLVRTRPMDVPIRESYATAWHRMRDEWLTPDWIAVTVFLCLAVPVSIIAEGAAQPTIPVLHHFTWDVPLDALERALHGGRPAWEWFRPLVTNDWAIHALDAVYFGLWPVAMLAAAVVPIIVPESFVRRRYVVASALTWYVGGVLAELLFSSGGPVYFGYIVRGPNRYAELMAYLAAANHQAPLTSFGLQQRMWISYTHRLDAFAIGVAAMPSLHVGSMTVLTCACFTVRRWLGVLLTIATLLVFLGSVALGWHYAIDGYAGALMAVGGWWVARYVVPFTTRPVTLDPARADGASPLRVLSR